MRGFKSFAGGCCAVIAGLSGSEGLAADMAVKAPQEQIAVAPGWVSSINTELQYYSWTSNRGFPTINDPVFGNPGKGSQIYNPTAYSLSGLVASDLKLEFTARTGVISSQQTTSGQEGRYAGSVDSQLSSTLTYSGINGIQPYVSLLLNLPTGASALYGTSRFARMDPDLVALSTFGEGLNIGPTAGINIPINVNLLASLSAGYTSRGAFNKEGAIDFVTLLQPTSRAKPGDSTTVTGSLGYTEGPFQLQGSVSYSWDSPSSADGFVQYRSGKRLMITGSGSYAWTSEWRTNVNAFFTHSERNDVPNAFLSLSPEASNSNSNVYRISADTTYTFSNGVTVGPTASYLFRDRNSYDPFTFAFVPAKSRVSAGILGSYGVGKFSVNTRFERIWTRENDNPGVITPVITADGWFGSLGATIQF